MLKYFLKKRMRLAVGNFSYWSMKRRRKSLRIHEIRIVIGRTHESFLLRNELLVSRRPDMLRAGRLHELARLYFQQYPFNSDVTESPPLVPQDPPLVAPADDTKLPHPRSQLSIAIEGMSDELWADILRDVTEVADSRYEPGVFHADGQF